MHMDPKEPMTPEAKDALKGEIMAAVDACLANEEYTSKEAILDKVVEDIEALKEAPGMGGMGEESDAGMKIPAEDDSDSDGE